MARVNENFRNFPEGGYLFSQIPKWIKAFEEQNPGEGVIRLHVGDTSEPLTPHIVEGLKRRADMLVARATYKGYGDEQGEKELRDALVARYAARGVKLDASEVFVSDGAKSDAANIQELFSLDAVVALQDPVYPVYRDSNVLTGRTGQFNRETGTYPRLVYMPCIAQNGFSPELPNRHADIIYLCSPNNPTGAVMTREKLKEFVDWAREHKAAIIFDAAYAEFIQKGAGLPRSIYEIEGADECAIEINSFSKTAGFTGVRLGWTVVPKKLMVEGSSPGELNAMWNRRQTTRFNGASSIAQAGGLAALTPEGEAECRGLIDYYMANAKMLTEVLARKGLKVYGGVHVPYAWGETPRGMTSQEFFYELLRGPRVSCTPGAGFGPSGEGYFRLSAFKHREDIAEAAKRIEDKLEI